MAVFSNFAHFVCFGLFTGRYLYRYTSDNVLEIEWQSRYSTVHFCFCCHVKKTERSVKGSGEISSENLVQGEKTLSHQYAFIFVDVFQFNSRFLIVYYNKPV